MRIETLDNFMRGGKKKRKKNRYDPRSFFFFRNLCAYRLVLIDINIFITAFMISAREIWVDREKIK